jgi:DNA-binding ferritin-like protein
MAWYCDPRSIESIRAAVLAAFEAPRTEKLREHIRRNCTWERAAERTLEGYRLALSLDKARREGVLERRAMDATRRHADLLARLAADRQYETRQMREWAERVQGEYDRVTARLLFRWSSYLARAGWSILRALGVKR